MPFSTDCQDIDFLTVPDTVRLRAANSAFARTLTAVRGYYGQMLERALGLGHDDRGHLTERNHIVEAILGHLVAHEPG